MWTTTAIYSTLYGLCCDLCGYVYLCIVHTYILHVYCRL